MNGFVILGTDTDAGKTTFAVLWLALHHQTFAYWKPVETGTSDTKTVRRLVPEVECHAPLVSLTQAVAPPLAARAIGQQIPSAAELLRHMPVANPGRQSLLVETFGSPFSPLNEKELQVEFIQRLGLPLVLVSSSALGAIGRTLQCLYALWQYTLRPAVVVLLGPRDAYAAEEIHRYGNHVKLFSLEPPESWNAAGIHQAAERQAPAMADLESWITNSSEDSPSIIGDLQSEEALLQGDRRYLWHPYTSLRDPDPPLAVMSAQDEFLFRADGRRIIDGISSWWTILHGHRHPVLMAALARGQAEFDHVLFAGVTHPYAVRLAELLLGSMPWTGGRVFCSDNGSTAVEVALKMAYQFWCLQGQPQRTLFIGFEHGYHGDTFGAMAASRDPVFFGRFEPLLFETIILPVSAENLDGELQQRKDKVAAVILEPLVQGAGGMRMHSVEELRVLFELTRKHDVLFIADEVMTGGGRLGPLWAHQAAQIEPDLICAAKTLTGGVLPLAATLAAPHIVAAFDTADRRNTFFHGHSFTAHPLACAVAEANWRMLMAGEITAPRRLESFWRQALTSLQKHPRVREVRIRGSIAAVELDFEGGYLADVGRHLRKTCLQHGVLLRPLGNVLYAMPPFCTSDTSLEKIAGAMIAAVKSINT